MVKAKTAFASTATQYRKLRLLREYQLPDNKFTVWDEHFKQETSSVMVIATNRLRVLRIDLRTMSLENPIHHGIPTCFCINRENNWLRLSTLRYSGSLGSPL